MNKYTIDYEYGIATIYTPSEDWENRFYDLASQCFGIRKSTGKLKLIEKEKEQPHDKVYFEYERLEHSDDVIVWNERGEKIINEWDSFNQSYQPF